MTVLLLLLLAQRPDPALTPGVTRPLSLHAICGTAWGRDRRFVTPSMKKHVFEAYGIPWEQHAKFEVDHLVPRELGGADDERNLWPQPWVGEWNAHLKDRLENQLHKQVCSGRMPLVDAQHIISADWITAYREVITGYRGTGS